MDSQEVCVVLEGRCLERHWWYGDDDSLGQLCDELVTVYPEATLDINGSHANAS